jgi:hypothetical protein
MLLCLEICIKKKNINYIESDNQIINSIEFDCCQDEILLKKKWNHRMIWIEREDTMKMCVSVDLYVILL